MKKYTPVLAIFLFAGILLSSCQKDIDKYSKISLSKWEPTLSVPFAKSTITFRDIIGNDSSILTNNDSSLVYVYRQDSVFSISSDSLMQFSTNISQQYSFSLGAINFDNFSDSGKIAINDILPYMDQNTVDTLKKYDGSNNVFPPFKLSNNFTLNLPALNNFSYLTFSRGTLTIVATNKLPVTIDTIFYNLVDTKSGDTLITAKILNLPPGAANTSVADLSGRTLGNQLKVVARAFSSSGSYPDKVPIDLSKGITFTFNAQNLSVVSGKAVIPQQVAITKNEMLNLNTDKGVRLYLATLSGGSLNYSVQSGLNVNLNATMTFPTALKDNKPLTENISVPAGNQTSNTSDLSGFSFDLRTDPAQKYNRLPVSFTASIPSTDQMVSFDSSNRVTATFGIKKVKFSSLNGYLGKQSYEINPGEFSFDLNFLNNLNGSLAFTHPEIDLRYRNDFGVPVKAKLYMQAFKKGSSKPHNLNFDSVTFKYPRVSGQTVYGTVNINKDNSSIVDFLSCLPDSVRYYGGFVTNPNGLTDNFISQNAHFTADADIRIPFSFKTSGVEFTDTVTDVHISPDDIPADSGTIVAGISNGLPFQISIRLVFPDSITGETLRTLNIGTIASAKVNNSGTENTPTSSVLNIAIPEGFIDDIQHANTMIIHLTVATYNGGTVPVQVFSDDKVKIVLGVRAKLNP